MLSVIKQNGTMPTVTMPNVTMPNVTMLSVIQQSGSMMSVI